MDFSVAPAHNKQIQTYLRLTGLKLGFLLNFGEALMKDGITRAVNGLEEEFSRQGAKTPSGEDMEFRALRLGVLARKRIRRISRQGAETPREQE